MKNAISLIVILEKISMYLTLQTPLVAPILPLIYKVKYIVNKISSSQSVEGPL